MFKTKKFIVFFAAALIGIALCQAAESKKPVKAKKASKSAEVKKVTKPKTKTIIVTTPAKNKPTNVSKDLNTQKKSVIALGFFSPMQFPCEDTMIEGFRFSTLYTYNKGVNGLDCGFICDSGNGGTRGIQVAVVNRTAGTMNGFSLGLINVAETEMKGLQIGGFYNQAGSDSQYNAGANYDKSHGCQIGYANLADSIFKGAQFGMVNISNSIFKGWQIGFVNLYEPPSDIFDDFQTKEYIAEKKKRSCIQIGVFNFNPNGIFPITLMVNF